MNICLDKKIPQIGIITCILYFIAVTMFLITKSEIALTIWEMFTIFGAPVILLVLIDLSNQMHIASSYRNVMLVFMACNCTLTGLAHIINITVTRKLISDGINVPNYFRIGYSSSNYSIAFSHYHKLSPSDFRNEVHKDSEEYNKIYDAINKKIRIEIKPDYLVTYERTIGNYM